MADVVWPLRARARIVVAVVVGDIASLSVRVRRRIALRQLGEGRQNCSLYVIQTRDCLPPITVTSFTVVLPLHDCTSEQLNGKAYYT